jgi:hypothetical protein
MKILSTTMLLLSGTVYIALAQSPINTVNNVSETNLVLVGISNLSAIAAATSSPEQNLLPLEIPKPDLVAARASTARTAAPAQLLTVPNPVNKNVIGQDPLFFGHSGLSVVDQANVSGFIVEPPDQALAVANGFVFEGVNLAFAIYDSTTGARLTGPISSKTFFLQPSNAFLSDPKAYYDADTNRWYVTMLEILGSRSFVLIAVSQTSNPQLGWLIVKLDTTDDGSNGTQLHPNCPCLGDQPLLGADRFGIYVSTNEFSLSGPGFNGAQIYAMDKVTLTFGVLPTVMHFSGLPLAQGLAYSVQPATTPTLDFEPMGGTEYFLSALDFNSTLDNRVAIWALTNTHTLSYLHPSVSLQNTVITSETYGQPPVATQRPGPILHPPLEFLNSNDDRMNQVVFQGGHLWSGVNTIVSGGRVGIAWFAVKPSFSGITLHGSISMQGYVAVAGDSVLFPSIGVNAAGHGAMTFTLVGPVGNPVFPSGFYPSMAYLPISLTSVAAAVRLAGPGFSPEDGFSGYNPPHVARWGDYSAAVAASDGSIWMAAEYIPNAPRFTVANWGTFFGQLFH